MIIFFWLYLSTLSGWAQTETPAESPSETPSEKVLTNSKLDSKMQTVMKTTLQINRESDGIAFLVIKGQSYTAGTQILFFRKRGSRLQTIATGTVATEQKNLSTGNLELLVTIDKTSIVKYPQAGDVAVPLSDPAAKAEPDKKDHDNMPAPEDKVEPKRDGPEGYLELDIGQFRGGYTSQYVPPSPLPSPSPTPGREANRARPNSGYSFSAMHIAYFSGLFPIGIEYDKHSGSVPTLNSFAQRSTYSSTESATTMSLDYRFKKIFKRFEVTLRLVSLSYDFETTVVDDALISTKVTGLGFGGRLAYEPVSPVWRKKKGEWFVQLQRLFVEYTKYPSLTAADGTAGDSRGATSPGSSGSEYRVGGSLLFWFDFIPLFKRWVFTASYESRSYDLKFAGPTQFSSPSYPIFTGAGAKDAESGYNLFVGVRFEDPIAGIFEKKKDKDKEKEEDKKP